MRTFVALCLKGSSAGKAGLMHLQRTLLRHTGRNSDRVAAVQHNSPKPAVRCARVQCLRCGTKPSFAAQRHFKAGGTSALRKIPKNACNRACARIRLQNLITEVTHALNGGRVWLKKR
jgi:hypothetical protein